MKIKELHKEFEKKGVKYTQIKRNIHEFVDDEGDIKKDGYFIYMCKCLDDNYVYYEVFRYRLIPQHPYSNEDYDMVEAYPTDNQFGLSAWCCSTKESVLRVLKKHFNI